MSLRSREEKEHKETKKKLSEKEDELKSCRAKFGEEIAKRQLEVAHLNSRIEQMRGISEELGNKVLALEAEKKRAVSELEKDHEQIVEKLNTQWKENLESLNSRWQIEYKKIQQSLERIQNASLEKERVWEERGKKVLSLYEKRESKEEDVKIIEHLEVELIRKQFELEREKQDLKVCKLELDNMEELYKRIFYSAQKNHKQSASFHMKKIRLPNLLNKSTHPLKEKNDS